MTKLFYEIEEHGFRIECEGHAGYEEKGKDIVCAGISTLLYTLAEYTNCYTHLKDGYFYLEGQGDLLPSYAEFTLCGLRLIERSYPEYFKIVKGCPSRTHIRLK